MKLHSTTTMAETRVATANTLSKEATLMTHSASLPRQAVYLIRGIGCNQPVTIKATISSDCVLSGTAVPVTNRPRNRRGLLNRSSSVMPEQRDQQDDRQRHAKQPQQRTFGEIHGLSSSMTACLTPGGSCGSAVRERSRSDSFSFAKNESESRKSARSKS